MNEEIKIISVGGSIIIPPEGFNVEFLKKFRQLILDEVEDGKKFILMIGGGSTCRQYQKAAAAVRELTADELDWLGIYTTHFNAHFVKTLFGDAAYEEIVVNPTEKVKTDKPIIIAGGWVPGWSTDFDAVKLAEVYGAKTVVNLSNIDYVYDADPRKNPKAKKIVNVSWPDFRKIVGDEWSPGANAPFDPIASKEAERLGLKVIFVKGTELSEVEKAIAGKDYLGTTIE